MAFDAASVHPYGSFWLDVLDKGIKAAAVVVGGAWALFSMRKSRTFQRKLEIAISGQIFAKDSTYYVLVTPSLKNLGQSLYSIDQKGTGLAVIALTSSGRNRISASAVFENDASIEPGEQIEDPKVIPIPKPAEFVALLLELRVISAGEEWNAKSIVRETNERVADKLDYKGGDEYA
jgi:hypothetical protein